MKGDFETPDRLTPEVLRMLAVEEVRSGNDVSTETGKVPEDDRRSGGEVVAKEVLRSARAVLGWVVDLVLSLVAALICVAVIVFILTALWLAFTGNAPAFVAWLPWVGG